MVESTTSSAVTVNDTSLNPTPQYNSANDHYYQFVAAGLSWDAAKASASNLSYRGLGGYLATVTSASEQAFAGSVVGSPTSGGYYWIGGSDAASEGIWKWVTGPESGQLISQGYSNWFPGANGSKGEPNGAPTVLADGRVNPDDEDGLALDRIWDYQWYDLPSANMTWTYAQYVYGYIVEYGGLPATYAISSSAASVNEGSSVTFTIDTKNIEWGKSVSYTLTGISQLDLASGSLTGTATVNQNGVDGRATVTVNLASDQATEGAESLRLMVESTTSSAVTVNDTSPAPSPTYIIAAAASTVNEGSTATFNLTTTNVASGTAVAFTLSGLSSSDVNGGFLTGSATIGTDGKATISVPIAADQLTEGSETLTISAGGATASSVVNDTSKSVTYSESHNLAVLVDKSVLGPLPMLLKGLNEIITFTNGIVVSHIVQYAGINFNYEQIDSLITTVTRDGEFTLEFSKEINDYVQSEANITYKVAVALVGAQNIDNVIVAVAGADGNYVG
jgi:hypothetical protein